MRGERSVEYFEQRHVDHTGRGVLIYLLWSGLASADCLVLTKVDQDQSRPNRCFFVPSLSSWVGGQKWQGGWEEVLKWFDFSLTQVLSKQLGMIPKPEWRTFWKCLSECHESWNIWKPISKCILELERSKFTARWIFPWWRVLGLGLRQVIIRAVGFLSIFTNGCTDRDDGTPRSQIEAASEA